MIHLNKNHRPDNPTTLARAERAHWCIRTVNLSLFIGIAALLWRGPFAEAPFRPAGGEVRTPPGGFTFLRGDSNDDGEINLADAVFTLNYLFLGGPEPICMAAADFDDDAEIALTDAVRSLNFLFLGGPPPPEPYPEEGIDPTEDLGCQLPGLPPAPPVGSAGGPDRELTPEEDLTWRRGREFFRTPARRDQGLGPLFNGDSCVSCHLDPEVGGAGGLDVDVVRFANVDFEGNVTQLDGGPAVSRHPSFEVTREECPPDTNVIELRQTPTVFGLGLVDRISEETILANADPDDADHDGISGRARMTDGGRVGRFGHKAGVPSLRDFAADALINEVGLTVAADASPFAVASDSDDVADPETTPQEFNDLVFFMEHLAPPERQLPSDPVALTRVEQGEALFTSIGCADCHIPSLEGADGPVAAYSDFLLHEVADPNRFYVTEGDLPPREFRTAPLWGFRSTGPWLHDGSAETFEDAIRKGHFGEASAAKAAYEELFFNDKLKLEEFVRSL